MGLRSGEVGGAEVEGRGLAVYLNKCIRGKLYK
jgi:hypothetical protein